MAEGIRRIARALYKRAGEEEKKQAKEFFEKLDLKGDGKISLGEFLKGVVELEPRLSNERVFKQLSSNADGGLSLDDALVLFYYKRNAITILQCRGCRELIFGPSFSCFECLFHSPDRRFALCCDCYGEGKLRHQHPLSPIDLLHDQALLDECTKRRTDDPKALAKKEMEKLSEIAKSYYRAASPEVKAMADDFFKSMDADGDSGVDLEEFLTFVRENGYTDMRNNHFFKVLDMDGNGSLGFWEVMTLYYIIKSGRPFCKCCAEFIPGIYFSCVDCFNDPKSPYNICCTCYQSNKCKHNHNGRALFLDNYTLLQAKQDPALDQVAAAGTNHKPPQISEASKPQEQGQVAAGGVNQQPKRDSAPKKSTVTAFPKTTKHSDPDTDYHTDFMMNQLNRVLSESTAIVARSTSTTSTYQTYYVNPQSRQQNGESSSQENPCSCRPNGESSSQAIILAPSPLKVAAVTFKVLEAALTIASLSTTLCTIL